MKPLNHISILGMGALGVLFGQHLASALGSENVTFLMDEDRYEKYKNAPVYCNDRELHFSCTAASMAKPADLLIVAVKSTGLDAALEIMKNSIGPDTVILSVMNGITSEEIIGERYGHEHLIYTVAQGMDAMKFGPRLNYTKMGCLVIGIRDASQQENLSRVCELFDRTRLPYQVDDDILHRLWSKFMLNVGCNQTCMVCSCSYKDIETPGSREREIMLGAMREVIAIANAEGIALTEKDLEEYDAILRTLSPDGLPSMAQDRVAGRHSEVEMFAGTILSYGKKHHIPTPVNEWLYAQVKEIEKEY